jgi:hypothetical protein
VQEQGAARFVCIALRDDQGGHGFAFETLEAAREFGRALLKAADVLEARPLRATECELDAYFQAGCPHCQRQPEGGPNGS